MPQQVIDTTTQNPGWIGDLAKIAFTKTNENVAELYAGQYRRNQLINGDFRFWQRGTTFGAAVYTADRWFFNAGGVDSPNVIRNPIAPGQFTDIRAPAFARVSYGAITDAAGHFVVFEQLIEGVGSYSGRKLTISFKVYNSGAAGRQIALEVRQNFGDGGSATVSAIGSKKFALAPGLNTITHTVQVPSAAGKVLGAKNSLGFAFWASAGTNWSARSDSLGAQSGDVHFTEVQIEEGLEATSFDRRPDALELLLCQRYYQKSLPVETAPSAGAAQGIGAPAVAFSGSAARVYQQFRTDMRAFPSVTIYRGSDATGGSNNGICIFNGSWTVASSPANVSATRPTGFQVDTAATFTMNAGSTYLAAFHWAADAEL